MTPPTFVSKQEMGAVRQAWERTKPNNWSASPGRGKDALKFKGWAAQGSRYLSRAAVVGAVVDGGIAAWTQWEADCNGAGRESRELPHQVRCRVVER